MTWLWSWRQRRQEQQAALAAIRAALPPAPAPVRCGYCEGVHLARLCPYIVEASYDASGTLTHVRLLGLWRLLRLWRRIVYLE